MATVRKDAARLSGSEWKGLISAIDATRSRNADAPAYQDFVHVHVEAMEGAGMHTWGVHSMVGMRGRNFLAWHRWFLLRFEQRLQEEDPGVAIPYWDWIANPRIPIQINRQAQLDRWHVKREWDRDLLPERSDLDAATRRERFASFQLRLESIHGWVHVAVGGDAGEMSTARSPADPVFWLHHANIDRLWARWQERNPRKRPRNTDERLKPSPIFGVEVSETLKLSELGYRYS
jgi:tyrosinase